MSGIWVFGYGSLVWNPGFDFLQSQIGFIRGYERRFWQGNDKHRGTPDKWGRVATLVETKEGQVWGRAFQLRDDDSSRNCSLRYLDQREAQLGGYDTRFLTFHPRDPRQDPFPVLVYVALPSSRFYLGPATVSKLADDISTASGRCGTNAEYVFKLAEFMKEEVPHIWDEHLFALESLLRARLKMNSRESPGLYKPPSPVAGRAQDAEDSSVAVAFGGRDEGGDFTSHVPARRLRCLDL